MNITTVGDLIKELQKYPSDKEVQIFDDLIGHWYYPAVINDTQRNKILLISQDASEQDEY